MDAVVVQMDVVVAHRVVELLRSGEPRVVSFLIGEVDQGACVVAVVAV
jgi:hypothetical protein